MKYKFQINISDNDYLEYNKFHMLRSPYGKKSLTSLRFALCVIVLSMALISLIANNFSLDSLITVIPVFIVLLLAQIFLKKFLEISIKASVSQLKKRGKMAYSASSVMEFFDDGFMETAKEQRVEQKYSAIERISVVEGKYVYLHVNNVMAYIIPNVSFGSHEQYREFVKFINEKCPNIDFYK